MAIKFIGIQFANKALPQFKDFEKVAPKAIRAAFYDIGKGLVKDMQGYIDEPKSGRIYGTKLGVSKFRVKNEVRVTPTILKKSGKHVASAPGEAPAKWTGKLRKSLDFQVIGANKQSLTFGINQSRWGCDYAQYLEYKDLLGMTGRWKIAPRPFVSRAYKENKERIVAKMQEAIQQAILAMKK
jgi:hypothetical protein